MSGVSVIIHKNKRVVCTDLVNCKPEAIPPLIDKAIAFIASQQIKSVLAITDVTGASFNRETAWLMKTYTNQVLPYLKAGATVGITGLYKVAYDAIINLSGGNIPVFDTMEQALDWLVEQ